jgi:Tol biopolymer transport system component
MNARRRAASLLLWVVLAACTGTSSPPSPTLAPAISASPAAAAPTSTPTAAPTETPTPTPTPAATTSPTPTPTAATGEIAFTDTVGGVDGVYVTDVASGMTTRLADGGAPSWSPDGTRIAYGRPPGDGQFTLWVMNTDGSDPRSLGEGLSPSWSPDGTRIAFSTSPIDLGDLWVMNADGSGRRKLAGGLQRDWSPDGTRIASVTDEPGGGEPHLVVARVDGSGATRLAKGQFPAWSPDGTRIAFVSWSEQPEIQVVDPATGTISTVAQVETDAHGLEWSPDGTRLSFITPGGDLRVVSALGGEVTTAASGLSFDAARSPDGEWFAFTVTDPESPTSDIYLSRADGSDRRQLTTSGTASGPAWRP